MAEEWERVRQALAAGAMNEAAQAFEAWRAKRGHSSRLTLVNLGYGKGYPNAVPLEKIPELLATNSAFFDLIKRIVR